MPDKKETLYVVFGEYTERVEKFLNTHGYKVIGTDRTLDAAAIMARNLDEVPDTYLVLCTALVSGVVDVGINYDGSLIENLEKLRMATPTSRLVLILPEAVEPRLCQEIVRMAIYDIYTASVVKYEMLPEYLSTRKNIADYPEFRSLPVPVTTEKPNVTVEEEDAIQKPGIFTIIWGLITDLLKVIWGMITHRTENMTEDAPEDQEIWDVERTWNPPVEKPDAKQDDPEDASWTIPADVEEEPTYIPEIIEEPISAEKVVAKEPAPEPEDNETIQDDGWNDIILVTPLRIAPATVRAQPDKLLDNVAAVSTTTAFGKEKSEKAVTTEDFAGVENLTGGVLAKNDVVDNRKEEPVQEEWDDSPAAWEIPKVSSEGDHLITQDAPEDLSQEKGDDLPITRKDSKNPSDGPSDGPSEETDDIPSEAPDDSAPEKSDDLPSAWEVPEGSSWDTSDDEQEIGESDRAHNESPQPGTRKREFFHARKTETDDIGTRYMPHKTIVVWSPNGWGKSFTAFNLAASAASKGFDTALVNYDLLCPELDIWFGIKQTKLSGPGCDNHDYMGVMTFEGFRPELMSSFLKMRSYGIQYLPAGNKLGSPGTPNEMTLESLEQTLKIVHNRDTKDKPAITIVDAGRAFENAPTLAALRQATIILVPTDGSPATAEVAKQQIDELNQIGCNPRFVEVLFATPGRKVFHACKERCSVAFDWNTYLIDSTTMKPQCLRVDGRRAWEGVLNQLAPTGVNAFRRIS
jgi:cellulose biosynthesis protein BcsQ